MKDVCARKHGGNPESVAAFRKIENHIAAEQARVLATFTGHPEGLIAQQIEDLLGMSCCSVSGRMAELKKLGLIRRKVAGLGPDGGPCYERRRTRSGCTAGVYVRT